MYTFDQMYVFKQTNRFWSKDKKQFLVFSFIRRDCAMTDLARCEFSVIDSKTSACM